MRNVLFLSLIIFTITFCPDALISFGAAIEGAYYIRINKKLTGLVRSELLEWFPFARIVLRCSYLLKNDVSWLLGREILAFLELNYG